MLSITSQSLQINKNAITRLAINQFQSTFISVCNGRDKYLNRSNVGFAHLRFTKAFELRKDGADRTSYEDTYVYYTTSTTTLKRQDFNEKTWNQKIDENLSDRAFNIRDEVLFAPNDLAKSFIFLVDLGNYFAYVTKEYARKHVVKSGKYEGRDVSTVILPNRFYKKDQEMKYLDEESVQILADKWNPLYIQHVTYSKYRKRGGLLKVESYKNGELRVVSYYVSTGEYFEDAKANGYKKGIDNIYFHLRNNTAIKLENGVEHKLSKVSEVSDIVISSDSNLIQSTSSLKDSSYPLHSSSLLEERIEECNDKLESSKEDIKKIEPNTNDEDEELNSLETMIRRNREISKPKQPVFVDYFNIDLD